MTLTELAALCEGAEGPSLELDARIAVAVRLDARGLLPDDHEYLSLPRKDDGCAVGTYWFHCRSGMSLRTAPAYTASLDAAMMLVPEGMWAEGSLGSHIDTRSSIEIHEPCSYDPIGRATAATPALALCAASLRAREAQAGRMG